MELANQLVPTFVISLSRSWSALGLSLVISVGESGQPILLLCAAWPRH